MTDINVTSLAIEAIRETKTRVRATGLAVELIRKAALPRVRTSGMAIEVLRTGVVMRRAQIIVATGD